MPKRSAKRAAKTPPRKATARAVKQAREKRTEPTPFVLPRREWDRGTELIRMFAATGWLANGKPQSLMIISEPGSGKTELLDRFNQNPWLEYASDLTVRGLYAILRRSRSGAVTHLVATEFQKYFMRKAATADNMLGTLCQAMEEGVSNVVVGDKVEHYGGAQLGFIGAITHKTFAERRNMLAETGFISRAAIFEWEMAAEEVYDVMTNIGRNDRSDLQPVIVGVPDRKQHVEVPEPLSKQFQEYVWNTMRSHTVLRVFQRFRCLAMACALLDGRDVVHARDVEKVVSFNPYWEKMWRG